MSFSANVKVATVLAELARYMTEAGDKNRAFAFSKAANAILNHDLDVADISNAQGIKGVGPSTIKLVEQILETGTCDRLEELKQVFDIPDLTQLTRIPGVGPVKAKKIFSEYNIKTLAELRQAVDKGIFFDSKVIEGLSFVERSAEYTPRPWAEAAGRVMIELLYPFAHMGRITFAGSIRRKKDLVRDIDILICCTCAPQEIYDAIKTDDRFEVRYGGQQKIRVEYKVYHGYGSTGSHAVGGDIVITSPNEWAFALCYLSGCKEFNEGMRAIALSKGYTLNEHRLESTSTGLPVDGLLTEESVFEFLDMPYVPPECRRTRNDAGRDFSGILNLLPKGEVHTHTKWSDGSQYINGIVASAKLQGYEFYGISDHTKALPQGVAKDHLGEYTTAIRESSTDFEIPVYCGLELDVNAAHQIVYTYDEVKPYLDYVILAIHHAIGTNMVARYLAAIQQVKNIPAIIAHLTGRLFGSRDIPEDQWEELFRVCAKKLILIELNGQPDRLDPSIDLIQMAKSYGCRFILSTDHHGGDSKQVLYNAWYMARAAGLTRKNVIITAADFKQWLDDVAS